MHIFCPFKFMPHGHNLFSCLKSISSIFCLLIFITLTFQKRNSSYVSMSVLQHIYIIHCLKGSCLYQLKFEMFLSIVVSKTRKLCLTPPNRSWDCLLKERETFWERVEWLERETTADGGAPTLTKYCKSPAVKPAAEGPQHKIFQIKYRPISL